jgi:hypothetical protein
LSNKNTELPDWTIRRHGDGWSMYLAGKADDGREAPASLKGILSCLQSMPGPIPDLADVGVASTLKALNQEFCALTGKRVRTSGFAHLEPRSKRGEWEAVVFVYGRRQALHPEGCAIVAPHVDAALRSFYSEPAPEPSRVSEPQWRRNLAATLLVRAFEKMPEGSALRSAWFVDQAIRLLTEPVESVESTPPSAPQEKPAKKKTQKHSRATELAGAES